jgi:endonuclease G
MGAPVDGDSSDDHLMTKPQYALSYNKEKNIPNWVSYSLNASHFGDVPRFKGKFIADESLPAGFYRVRHEDYVGSGFDRGHLVRSEERTRTPEDNKATFLLTNILPQYHDLNAGPWLRLEEHAQDLAQKEKKQLYIVTGGIFNKKPETIGKGVAVPSACFKVVVVVERGEDARHVTEETPIIAVVMPNKEGIMGRGWEEYRTSVDDIERRTGYELLSRVAEGVQKVIEARAN